MSEEQTKNMCSMFKSIVEYFSPSSNNVRGNGTNYCKETTDKVLDALLSSIKYYIDEISSDRTEVRLLPFSIDDKILVESTSSEKASKSS